MYDSLVNWMNVPFQIKPFKGRSGAGTKLFEDSVDALCYPESDVKLVTDASGAEVVSTSQLYVPGDCPIKSTDDVLFENEVRPVKRISAYYRNGVVDIKVVYI